METLRIEPCWDASPTPLRHTWEGVVNVDQYRWLVRQDQLDQLELAQRELGARHVRAVGMFDDEMRVYAPGPESVGATDRPPRTNWQMLDYVWDELLARQLSPMITTSFIPSRMASGETSVFTTQGRTSPPRNYAEWSALVTTCVRHAVDRYGLEVVRSWYFEVWNEPNLQGWFWGADQAEFWQLWASTYRAIKQVDARLRVGGPSTARAEWIAAFLEFARREGCPPDYLTLHIYNNDGAAVALAPFAGPQEDKAGTSPNLAAGVVRGVRQLADTLGFRGELHFNEWGSSWRGYEPARETPNEAAFVVRMMAEVSQLSDQYAYWCISDIYDQVGYGRETFHGNYGLLNLQGLRKPAYHAFELLSRLGTTRLPVKGQATDNLRGAIVTRDEAEIQILIYAYRSPAMAEPSGAPPRIQVEVTLPSDVGPEAVTRLHRIDSRENNVVARWRQLGAPVYLHPRERAELAAVDALQVSDFRVALGRRGDNAVAVLEMEEASVALLTVATQPRRQNPAQR